MSQREERIATPALRYWRLWAAHTQASLATEAGVSVGVIRRLEHGGRTTLVIIEQLTECLQLETEKTVNLAEPLTDEQRAWVLANETTPASRPKRL